MNGEQIADELMKLVDQEMSQFQKSISIFYIYEQLDEKHKKYVRGNFRFCPQPGLNPKSEDDCKNCKYYRSCKGEN